MKDARLDPLHSIRRELYRQVGSYNDRNDGFMRGGQTSRIRKTNKRIRVKPPHRSWTIEPPIEMTLCEESDYYQIEQHGPFASLS